MVIPSDEGPDTNQDAYKPFVAPKKEEYKYPEISQKDISDFVTKLDSKDSKDLQKFAVALLYSHSQTLSRIEQLEKLLVEKLVNTQNYLLTHQTKMLLKLVYSENIENRLRTNRRNGWIVVATVEGSKEREKAILLTIRENGFRPEPSSEEIFTITLNLVDVLCANNWVGANENREFILDKFPQQKIFSD
tara:strand:+ start:846 stop:1415 length:570 start_codon:yes stop_codon:yes gene_type:complete